MLRTRHSWLLLLLAWTCCDTVTLVKSEENLYKILGVSRTATTKQIKTAYRRKALDTHPDKNKGVPPEEAAAAFHKVVHAFEILSDSDSRNRYDRTGQSGNQQQQQQQQRGGWSSSWSFTWNSGGGSSGSSRNRGRQQQQYRRWRLKDKFEVKEAQSRILHIVSLEQLETVIVDDETDELERNLLICFYTPQLEEHVMDEMVYPYPFAAMSDQGIWWEDLLQTTVVRFHRSNKLTEFFEIPKGDTLEAPIFIFGKRGTKFDKDGHFTRLQTRDRMTFDRWVWQQIELTVLFVNEHDHPVEVYWIHGTSANKKMILQPGETSVHNTKLSHEWWVRDARTDTHRDSPGRHRLTDNNSLISWKITNDVDMQRLAIPKRTCFDLSGHCPYWHYHGECRKNPNFMRDQCMLTCAFCEKDLPEEGKNSDYNDDEL
ncbi:unnamed protein product [Cylindrotheca closterium]|uniref:J domain-containing protein n=1 Tax=Cylindrotheca closterium TaxID=2856 RepID=A0AAD2D012_9STRA|nr:unnamed protein product [Cylindrotheca closterium]